MPGKQMTLEGRVEIRAYGLGGKDIYIGEREVTGAIHDFFGYETEKLRAILMVEDKEVLEAEGKLYAREGEGGYSSWTPGCGAEVTVGGWGEGDIGEKLYEADGQTVALSLEEIA